MATRLRVTNVGAAYTPATVRGTWNATVATASAMQVTPSGGGNLVTPTIPSTAANYNLCMRRFVSAPMLTAGALAGTVSWVLGVRESNANANAFFHVHIYVTAGDSDTVRGTLLSDYIGSTEFVTTFAGMAVTGLALSSVDCQIGDRIVAVVGLRASATATTYTGGLYFGGTSATDLAAGSTATSTNPGWFEFSGADALFAAPVHTDATTGDNECPNPAAANDVTGWVGYSGTATRVTGLTGAPRTTGVSVATSASAFTSIFKSAAAVAAAGQVWSGVAWVRSTVTRTYTCSLLTTNSLGNGSQIIQLNVPLQANTWALIRLPGGLTGTDTVSVSFYMEAPSSGTAGTLTVTAVRLTERNASLDYGDGSTSGWQWDGASGNSTSQVIPPSPTPGSLLNIGPGALQNHFSVQVPVDNEPDIQIHDQNEINAGYYIDPYFRSNLQTSATAVQFRPSVSGPTVGSPSCRVELREVNADGSNAAWDPMIGTHVLHARLKALHLPPVLPDAVFAQAFNTAVSADRVSIRSQLVSATTRLRARINGTSATPELANWGAGGLGTEFEYKIEIISGLLNIYYNNMVTPIITSNALTSTGATWYFKTGCYLQTVPGTDVATEYGLVEIRDLWVTHTYATTVDTRRRLLMAA